jgi:hypothetical protein
MHRRSKCLYKVLVGNLRGRGFLRNLDIVQEMISVWMHYRDVNRTEFAQIIGDL